MRTQIQVVARVINQFEWQHVPSSLFRRVVECNASPQMSGMSHESSPPACGSIFAMPRLQAILVIVGLLASPVALLARGIFCDPSECTCAVVCPMHAAHSQPKCGAAKQAPACGTQQGRHALDYGFVTPFAPALPLAHAQIATPAPSLEFRPRYAQVSADGVSTAPFNPPRS